METKNNFNYTCLFLTSSAAAITGVFKLSLKYEYHPASVNEDFLIEDILQRAFQNDQLQYQSSKLKFDFTQIITEKKAEINVEEYKNMFAKMKKKK